MIPHCFINVAVWSPGRSVHDWCCFTLCISIQVYFYCIGSVIGITVMLMVLHGTLKSDGTFMCSIRFCQDLQHHSTEPWQNLRCMLQMAVDTHTLTHWWWFELNSSNMGSSLHKSCCHWFLFQFLAYLGILFFLSSFLMASWQSPIHWEYLMRLWWTLDISTKGLDASKKNCCFFPFCLSSTSPVFSDFLRTQWTPCWGIFSGFC